MGGLIGSLVGTNPTQQGEATTGGQTWFQNMLKPMLEQGIGQGTSGQGLYPTAGLPNTPNAQGYQAQGAQAPQAPYNSPSDYLGQYQDTSMNAMEQFWGGGGGGSAMGGWSGSGVNAGSEIATWAGRNAMQDYNNERFRYDQMQLQSDQFNAQGQNQAGIFNSGEQNQMARMGYGGGLQQMQNKQLGYRDPWTMFSQQYPTTFGSPIIGEGGVAGQMPGGSFFPSPWSDSYGI